MPWDIVECKDSADFTSMIARLRSDEVAGVRVHNFLEQNSCDQIANAYRQLDKKRVYEGKNVRATSLGEPAIKFRPDAIGYFTAAGESAQQKQDFFSEIGISDPTPKVLTALAAAFPQMKHTIGTSEDAYFSGIIRSIIRSPLHNDYAPRDFVEWPISSINDQLAWNIYLSAPFGGGQTMIYKKRWHKRDEKFKLQNEMGYDEQVVAGAESTSYAPVTGDLLVFNSVNYHEVCWNQVADDRIAIGGFVGLSDTDGKLFFWS